MGRETTLQALPSDWCILLQVFSGELAEFDFNLQSVHCYFHWIQMQSRKADLKVYFAAQAYDDDRHLYEETLSLTQTSPGIIWRNCDLDRRFEILLYLLRETTSCVERLQLFDFAIQGRNQVHPEAFAGQGHPIMWNDAETNRCIHDAISPIEFCDLAAHFRTDKYNSQTLYKQRQNNDWRSLAWLQYCFSQLKEFYRSTANTDDVTIVIVD